MELGATVCTPSDPKCLLCPVVVFCEARRAGRERELPVKSRPFERRAEYAQLLIIERQRSVLMWQRPADSVRLAGFWEFLQPHMVPEAQVGRYLGEFRHSITNTSYTFAVHQGDLRGDPNNAIWIPLSQISTVPLSTAARKAIEIWKAQQ